MSDIKITKPKKIKKIKKKRSINRKAKGINAERDLIHKFHALSWSAVRIAGSGSTRYPAPDLLAGNGHRRIAIEAKSTADSRKYFSHEDIDQLRTFSRNFGCEFWLAVKFQGENWTFFHPEDLQETKTAFVATVQLSERIGLNLSELLAVTQNNPLQGQNL
ncbi:hypothetical protein HOC01_02140 [archaeon]|jgi:holliday junction resolvase Hjr|nr:hypothetical protein [archaeon]MBT6697881.1 hypothetical protein [archaeon]